MGREGGVEKGTGFWPDRDIKRFLRLCQGGAVISCEGILDKETGARRFMVREVVQSGSSGPHGSRVEGEERLADDLTDSIDILIC